MDIGLVVRICVRRMTANRERKLLHVTPSKFMWYLLNLYSSNGYNFIIK